MKFTGLLNQLKRDFRQVKTVDHGNGFAVETYTEDNEYTLYKVEYWEGKPRTIITPDKRQYYKKSADRPVR